MATNDPLSDMLTRIRNGQNARLAVIKAPATKLLANVCDVLKREGYIRDYSVAELEGNKRELSIELKYFEGQPAIREIKRISTPGRRHYSSIGDLPKFHNGLGIGVISTSRGVVSDFEARKNHVGGEVLCSIF